MKILPGERHTTELSSFLASSTMSRLGDFFLSMIAVFISSLSPMATPRDGTSIRWSAQWSAARQLLLESTGNLSEGKLSHRRREEANPTGNNPAGNNPAGNIPAGNNPAGNNLAGYRPPQTPFVKFGRPCLWKNLDIKEAIISIDNFRQVELLIEG